MKNTTVRLALLSSVSTAFVMCALPGSAFAQATTCSQTGANINCVDGPVTVLGGTVSGGTTVVPGPGLVAINTTAPATILYSGSGPISTTSVRAVNLTSTGGALNFAPVSGASAVNINTTGGVGADGVTLNTIGQAATVTVGNISTTGTGSFGVRSNGGTDLTLRTGDITTTGAASRGIQANNYTGAVNITAGNLTTTDRAVQVLTTSNATVVTGNVSTGASGVLVNGNNVNVTTGNVNVTNGFGVIGQGIGAIGNVVIRTGAVTSVNGAGVGGSAFSAVGSVDIGCGNVTSNSPGAAAVFAQNNGTGALTINCGAVSNVGNNGVFARSFGAIDGGNIAITAASIAASNTNFSSLFARTEGTGKITINAGTVTGGANPAGAGAIGIDLFTGTGAIDAGYGNVTTVGTALQSISNGTLNLRGAGSTLRTSGAAATGAVLTANGVTGNLGNVITTGVGSQGAVITSTAPVNLTIGNVATTGNGVTINAGTNAVTLATGTVTATELGATGTVINSTGPITFTGGRQTSNGANALAINGGAGAINVNVAGATTTGPATAVNIVGTGPLTFANSATISTTGANSTGLNISGVTTASVNCGNVSTTGAASPAVVVGSNGTTNVTCGTVTTTGAASDAILVSNTLGTTTVTGGTTSATGAGSRGIVVTSSAPTATGLVTVNSGVVTANGNAVVATSTGGANVVVNANGNVTSTTGTGITATTAGTTFVSIGAGTTASGVQGVNLQGVAGNTLVVNGTLRNAAGTTPYTVLNGGPFTLTLGAMGSIVGPLVFTTGNDTFNNQGTFALPAALNFLTGADVLNNSGTLTSFNGTAAISDLETFNNVGGLIDMRDGAANDVVNLGTANFVGSGNSRLGLDVSGDNNGLIADRLVLGGNASGSTALQLNFLNGFAVVDPSGVLLVDAGTATGNPFTLAGPVSAGLVNFGLQQTGGDTFLVSTVDEAVFDTLVVSQMAMEASYQSLDAYLACAASRRSDASTKTSPFSLCGQLFASNDRTGDNGLVSTAFGTNLTYSDRRKTKRRGAQIDLGFKVGGTFAVGLTGGYGHSETMLSSGTDIDINGHNVGAYAEFGAETGLYAGVLAKLDRFDVRFGNGEIIPLVRVDGRSKAIDGKVGFRVGQFAGAKLDANVGLSYVSTRLDDFNTGNISFDNSKFESLRGRAGARLTWDGNFAPFIDAKVYREFRGDSDVGIGSGLLSDTLDSRGRGTWGRIEAGVAGNGMLSAWVDVGDVKGWGVRAGFRF